MPVQATPAQRHTGLALGGVAYGVAVKSARHPAVAVLAVVAALAAGCTSAAEPGPPGTTAPPTGTATSAPTSAHDVTVGGAPAQLATLVETIYRGGDLSGSATASAAAALRGRHAATTAVTATASTGKWQGEQVAVVTADDDVTLAVAGATQGDPAWRVVGGWWPSLGIDRASLGDNGPRWVLALGSDARPGESITRTRADVLQVVGVDGRGGGGILGLPRDLWVPLSTGGTAKINAAMAYGGPSAQLATVRRTTGLPVEGYVLVGFEGFEQVVDEQGGIPIVIRERVRLGAAGGQVINPGLQTLTGAHALAYSRERKSLPDGDFGRSRHQGEILLAAAIKAKLAGPQAIPSAMTSIDKVATTNLDAERLLTFAASLYRLSPLQVGRGVAHGPVGWAGQQSIVEVGDHARSLFRDFKDGNLS